MKLNELGRYKLVKSDSRGGVRSVHGYILRKSRLTRMSPLIALGSQQGKKKEKVE